MCGLAFFTGKGNVDLAKMTVLGILNETRGEDSCGISFNNQIWWGKSVGKYKFRDFMPTFDQRDMEGVNTMLLHTRKSTSGHGARNAHPFGFRVANKSGAVVVNDPQDDYQMIGMHNGTVTNEKWLKQHFKLDGAWADMDSKVMLGALFQHKNYEILKNYEGKAVLVWYSGDDMFVFKGADHKGLEDRSLFYVQEPEGIYFSSLESSLKCISQSEVKAVVTNHVYHLNKGALRKETPVERTAPKGPLVKRVIRPSNVVYSELGSQDGMEQDQIYMHNCRYYANGEKLHGEVRVDSETKKVTKSFIQNSSVSYFLDGIMLKSKPFYERYEPHFKKIHSGSTISKIKFSELSRGFDIPAYKTKDEDQKLFYSNPSDHLFYIDGDLADGAYTAPITYKSLEFAEGIICYEDDVVEEFFSNLALWYDDFEGIMDNYKHVVPNLTLVQQESLNELCSKYDNIKQDSLFRNL
jgi:hypothetical protein